MDRTDRSRLALRAAESALWDAYTAVRALGRSALPVRGPDVLHAEGHVLRALGLLGDVRDEEGAPMDVTRHLPPRVAKQLARTRRSEGRMRFEPTETNVRHHVCELLVLERLLGEWADGMEGETDGD